MWASELMPPPPPGLDRDDDDSRSPLKQAGGQQQQLHHDHHEDHHALLPGEASSTGQDQRHDIPEETLVKLEAAANALPFALLCDKFEMAEKEKLSADKKRQKFFGGLVDRLKKASADGPVSLYPILKLLLPETGTRQGQYKLQCRTMGPAIVKALGLNPDSETATRLTGFGTGAFNRSTKAPRDRSGDFAKNVESVLTTRIRTEPSRLTLKDIDNWLDRIVTDVREKDKSKEDVFVEMLSILNPREVKWLVRIILGDMKTGMKKDSVLKIFGEDGPKRLETTHNLRQLSAEDALGVKTETRLQLMTPFNVHVCARATSASAALTKMDGVPFVMERKVDGERYVLHKKGQQLRFVSRTLKDARPEYYTALTDMLLQRLDVEDLILDGEVVAWSDKLGDYEKFGSNKTVAIAQAQEAAAGIYREGGREAGAVEGRNLMYVAFDVVYVGGRGSEAAFRDARVKKCKPWEVGKKPLEERRALLSAIVKTEKKLLEIVEHRVVGNSNSSSSDSLGGGGGTVEQKRLDMLASYFEHAVENGWEGLVIKRLDSAYMSLGGLEGEKKVSREKGGWVKMKPDYAEVTEEMDVVLLGGYYREGALWSGYPSRFLFGVRSTEGRGEDDEEEEEEEGGREVMYHPFSKIANGLKTSQREDLQEQLKDHWMEGGPNRKFPPWILPWAPAKEDTPAVWLDIKNAPVKVVSVKGGELVRSRFGTAGITVRFPRITRLRPDKGLEGVMTDKELKEMKERPRMLHFASQSQFVPGMDGGGVGEREGGRMGKRKRGAMPLSTPGWAAGAGGGVEVKGKVFEGLNICLYGSTFVTAFPGARALMGGKEGGRSGGGRGEFSLQDVMRVVKEQGGEAGTNLVEEDKATRQMYADEEEEEEEEEIAEEEVNGGQEENGGEEEEDDFGESKKKRKGASTLKNGVTKSQKKNGNSSASSQKQQPRKSYEQDCLVVPSGKPCRRTAAAKLTRGIDILSFEWLLECLQAGRRVAPRFEHYIGMTRETEERMGEIADVYGDPWTEPNGTVEELQNVLKRMPSFPSSLPSSSSSSPFSAWQRLVVRGRWRAEEEEEVLTDVNLFWGREKVFYLDRYADCGSLEGGGGREEGQEGRKPLPFTTLDAAAFCLRLHGAVLSSTLHAGVSHVIVDQRERSRFPLLLARKRELRRHPWNACEKWVVDLRWVEESVAAGRLLGFEEEGEYEGGKEGEGRRYLVSDKELAGEERRVAEDGEGMEF